MKNRYEIKIPISQYNENILSNFLLSLSDLKIQNKDREINNIYYDTLNLDTAKDNLDGVADRVKYRARWYKNDSDYTNCNFEIKIKNGRTNSKLVFPSEIDKSSILNCNFIDQFKDRFVNKTIYEKNLIINKFFPIIQNKYDRSYYIYKDKIRLTYDKNISYKNLKTQSFSNWNSDALNVLEIKIDTNFLEEANLLIKKIPFVPKRHSKYLRGLSCCKMALYI